MRPAAVLSAFPCTDSLARNAFTILMESYRGRVGLRRFSVHTSRCTDGVYRELTEMRVRRPWIEAFRESQRKGDTQSVNAQTACPPKLDLTPKTMADSYVRLILPLGQDPWMLDTYANVSGQIRIGTLLMDLDAMAGVVAYKYTGEGVSTVTAAVDRITIQNPLTDICDLELSGQVTFATGRSSMEVTLQIARAPAAGSQVAPSDVFMTCAFTMVALDPISKRPTNVAPLRVESEADKALYAQGQQNYNSKKALKSSHITAKPPDGEESKLIHRMWTESLAYADKRNPAQQPGNVVAMAKTSVHSTAIMQPQYRNRHNFMIFGGYLLKQTFELAFTCAAAFSHTRVNFVNLDPSTFEESVPVGSVLYISAGVTYTEPDTHKGGTRIQVMVSTHVRNVEHAERKNTGTFFYTFHSEQDIGVLPQTYSEFMRWISGRRRARRLDAEVPTDREQPMLRGSQQGNVTE